MATRLGKPSLEARQPSVFHFTDASLLEQPEASAPPFPNPQLGRNLAYAEPLSTKLGHSIAVEDPLGAVWWEILS